MSTPPMSRMPTRSDHGKLQDCKSIGDALKHPEMVVRFKEIVPRQLSPDRMLRTMAVAVHRTPKLAQCNIMSLLGAMLTLASLGLEPNNALGHAYLIPFDKREKINGKWQVVGTDVQVVLGYQGLIELSRRSGLVTDVQAEVVYEGDDFTFEYGTNRHLRHIPKGSREGRRPIAAYCFVTLKDGNAFEVLPYEEVLRVRDGSESYKRALRDGEDSNTYKKAPWVAYEHEMAQKTMIRRISKKLPKSIEFAAAVAIDESADRKTLDYGKVFDATAEETFETVESIAHDSEEPMSQAQPEQRQPEPVQKDTRHVVVEPMAQPESVTAATEVKKTTKEATKETAPRYPAPLVGDEVSLFSDGGAGSYAPADRAIDDLRAYMDGATSVEEVETYWQEFEEKNIQILDIAKKQEAIRIFDRRHALISKKK